MYACLDPSKNSRILAKNLVTALDGVSPIYEPKEFFEAGTRYINGNQMCDEVGLGKTSLYCKFPNKLFVFLWRTHFLTHIIRIGETVIRGIIWGLMATSYTTRSIPSWDRWMIKTFRALFWDYIVEHKDGLKGGWKYEFKYVPQIDSQTGVEKGEAAPPRRGMPPLEIFGLVSFGLTILVGALILSAMGGAALHTWKSYPHLVLQAGSVLNR